MSTVHPIKASESVGKKYGRLTVLRIYRRLSKTYAVCLCDCGKIHEAALNNLRRKKLGVVSCRCHIKELTSKRSLKHGSCFTTEYKSWSGMKDRCLNPLCRGWSKYGGRGITVCERWSASFEDFLEDMGRKPSGTTLDRRDNDGPYSPENCRWATATEQQRNRGNNRRITINGVTKLLCEWSEEFGISKQLIRKRISKGVTGGELLNKPRPKT